MIRTAFTLIGLIIATLYVLGALGIGHFRVYYGEDSPAQWCAKERL